MFWDPILTSELFRIHGPRRGRRSPFLRTSRPPQSRTTAARGPAINLSAKQDEARLTALVPGLATEDLELSLEGDRLTLAGEFRARSEAELDPGSRPLRERFTGRFTRTIRLPFPCDHERIEASLARGVLEVRLPRAASDRPRKIEISSR